MLAPVEAESPAQAEGPVASELCGFSIPNSAKRLDVSKSFMWSLVRENKVKTVRLGKRRIIPSSEIERILAEAV